MKIKYDITRLDNGLTLITAPMADTRAVTMTVLVGAGSRFETAGNNGVAHFLEHMFFKGTTKRPTTIEIARELDSMGANYNAFTGEELTAYYVRVAAEDFHHAWEVFSDMFLDPLFVADEIEREKGVIVEELNMYEDTPMITVQDRAKKLLFGDTPLGRNIVGSRDSVLKLNRQDFVNFREKFYRPDNLIVSVVGAGRAEDWKKTVVASLGGLSGRAEKRFVKADSEQKHSAYQILTKKTDQAHLVLGLRSFPRTDKRWPALKVLSNLLGGTMGSRLFIEVRERRGLAYYVGSERWSYRDAGALIVRAGVKLSKIDEALEVIVDELLRLKDQKVSKEELTRSKSNLRGSMYLGLEDSMSISEFLADQQLYWNEIRQPEDIVAAQQAVTAHDIKEVAKLLVRPENLNLTVLGPFKDEDRFKPILSRIS